MIQSIEMNKKTILLSVIFILLLAGAIYLYIHNKNNPTALPILEGQESAVKTKTPTTTKSSDEVANEDVESSEIDKATSEGAAEQGITTYSDNGFNPAALSIPLGETITVHNTTNQTVLIAPSTADCVATPAVCEVLFPGDDLSFTISTETTYQITDTKHQLTVQIQ